MQFDTVKTFYLRVQNMMRPKRRKPEPRAKSIRKMEIVSWRSPIPALRVLGI